ncbi:thioredoxin [Thioalkalivibrio denitrificans]|uniref:Thioredoxin n=1 Tax=Thioalkalivibrio denitrificans TaxID=108003 RepID=A0A1V3NFN6_9GAMM|nr:thioredoxin [Thioalkalivibrio denitrificans]OOG23870.1 thioredoxin [Thioalkalivibrio denitrificans]
MPDSPFIIDVTQSNFTEVVLEGSRERPVLVDFWADWCQPCRILMPVLAKIVEDFAGRVILAKVNSDQQQALAAQFGIRSLPTVMVFRHGKPVDQFMGVQPESAIRTLLERHLPRESDNLRSAALEKLRAGDAEGALAGLQAAFESDPDNQALKIDIARALVALGRADEADETLKTLPMDLHQDEAVRRLEAQVRFARVAARGDELGQLEAAAESGDNPEAMHRVAAAKILAEDYETALPLLLRLMQKHRKYGDDAGHKGLLAAFELLGAQHPLVKEYRRKMVSLLY